MRHAWILAILVVGCGPQVSIRPRFNPPSALDLAIEQRDFAAVERLTRDGVPSRRRVPWEPPLQRALRSGQSDVAELLIARGAEVRTLVSGEGPLEIAAAVGDIPNLRRILKIAGPVRKQGWGPTALHTAAKEGQIEAMRILLDAGAPIEAVEPYEGRTPLAFAAEGRQVEAVRFLLARGANPNPPTYANPLQRADISFDMGRGEADRQEVIRLLEAAGAKREASGMPFSQEEFRRAHPELKQVNPWTGLPE